jgi:predicted transcriptional regulator
METSFIHIKIDKELKKELQILALKENKTLTDLLTELIKDFLNEKK